MIKCRLWFDFAEKTRKKDNKESDFESFKNIPVFMDIMEKLRTATLSQDDFEYITDQAEHERGLEVYREEMREEFQHEDIAELLELDTPTMERFMEQIREEDSKKKNDS